MNKTMKFRYLIAPLALAAVAFCGCQESAEYQPVIYMTDAQANPTNAIRVEATPASVDISVSASEAVGRETSIVLETRPDLLEAYNATYGKAYAVLPENSYELPETTVTIKEGFITSNSVKFTVTSMEEFVEGTTYCMPVAIRSTDGTMPVLEPSRTVFLVVQTPVFSRGVYINSSNKYKVPGFRDLDELKSMTKVTLECRIWVNAFTNNSNKISSIMGVEGNLGLRFGDVKIDRDQIQVCVGQEFQPSAAMHFETKKWYHVATVWDGKTLDLFVDGKYAGGMATDGRSVNISGDTDSYGFGIGAFGQWDAGRPLNGYIAEARVWKTARTAAELANNMNYIDPQTEGLVAYWRMNASEPNPNGSGNIIRDETGHGYDAQGGASNPSFLDAMWW